MFVLSNAWRSVTRNKGRNMIIIVIVAIIAAAATIGLSIRQAADTTKANGLANTSVTAQISVDRSKLFSAARAQSGSSGGATSGSTPDFKSLRASISGKELKLTDYEKYRKASTTVTGTYYTETTSLSKTTKFQPVSSTQSSSSSSSSSGNNKQGNGPSNGGVQQGGMGGGMEESGDFKLTGFSSDTAVKNASNGTFTMTKGKVFGYTSADIGKVIISKSLADFDNLSVGDTVSVANPSDSSKTYTLTIVGIYSNTSSSSSNSGPSLSTASDSANAIYTSVATVDKLGLGSTSSSSSAAQLSYSYVFANKAGYDTFVKQVKQAGLSSDYTVSSSDVEEYESSLIPLNNLSKFALTLLLIVLSVGAIVLVALNIFNIRERKYEVGVLTAIGVNKIKVATQFVLELFIVTLIGLAIGAGVGAATSVPVSNQLLASQVASQKSQQTSQQQQFGRAFNQGGSSTSGSTSGSTGSSQSGSQSGQSSAGGQSGQSRTGAPFGRNSPFSRTTTYISSINSTVSFAVIGELLLIAIGLTVLSSLVAIVFVMRYEPLQILADRS